MLVPAFNAYYTYLIYNCGSFQLLINFFPSKELNTCANIYRFLNFKSKLLKALIVLTRNVNLIIDLKCAPLNTYIEIMIHLVLPHVKLLKLPLTIAKTFIDDIEKNSTQEMFSYLVALVQHCWCAYSLDSLGFWYAQL